MTELEAHWDAAYAKGADRVSWAQEHARPSLALIDELAVPADAAIIDVGGGASPLAADLVERGFRDVTVLDLSPLALATARERLGDRADAVSWLCADLRAWSPPRSYGLWHDRAVLHFLTDPADRAHYAETVARAVEPGGHAIIAGFAPDGPEQCSGLPVQRATAEDLAALLGDAFVPVAMRREEHTTPSGNVQPFAWLAARRG